MSDTPRTDAAYKNLMRPGVESYSAFVVMNKLAHDIERELATVTKDRDELWQRRNELVCENAKIARERDEWRACAKQLMVSVDKLRYGGGTLAVSEALARFRELEKGATP